MKAIDNLIYLLLLPLACYCLLVLYLFNIFGDLEKAFDLSQKIIQPLAIAVGGLWAYKKFDWGKRAENAIKIKALLMEYMQQHSMAAMQYRLDQSQSNKGTLTPWINFVTRMIPEHRKFASQVHLSAYLPKQIRRRLFDTVWLSLNNGKGPDGEDIDANWKKLQMGYESLQKELDDVVSK